MLSFGKFIIASVFLAATATVNAAPINMRLQKRIAQVIADSTHDWEQACLAAGGAQQCNPISVAAFTTLLAAAGPCEQQDQADNMIDLAKQLGNDAEMIRLAQLFVQQPRNAPDSLQVPYCQTAPRNAELNGLFHCQFAGSDFTKFSGDQTGNVPLGLTAVSPPGSCPAHTAGPVPDGVQLNTLVQSPGSGSASSSSGSGTGSQTAAASSATTKTKTKTSAATATAAAAATTAAAASTTSASTATTNNSASNKSFLLQNGKDAQSLNAKFQTLAASDSCTDGETACVDGDFAMCANGAFVVTPCSGGIQCFALPLVNSRGTSVTCDTQADALARIAATGATGGLTGSN
ncbi:hypothetical protein C8Q75DRAFT_785857 [Abortiporus biennis]|nr:hypothetical protein C8Q75DRAFT_785857 [Abortiporus biennis]